MKYYQVVLDNNRKKFLWAKSKNDLLAKCLEEYPEATVNGIWVENGTSYYGKVQFKWHKGWNINN